MKKIWIGIGILLIIGLIGAGVWFLRSRSSSSSENVTATGDARFGFVVGPDAESFQGAVARGAGFVRPHPGAFVWGKIQKSAGGDFDFSETDQEVELAQENGLQILATLWPFAEWDQAQRTDYSSCKTGEEFSFELGEYRCNPSDWTAYAAWVKAVVERYDGDGQADMPELKTTVKYWEILNEPDLTPPPGMTGGLQFYKQGPVDYGELLKKTYQTIKSADATAQVLIAGAAGGDKIFLDFYRKLFADTAIKNYFDIANVHCITNGDWQSFNVVPYQKMLAELGIEKPIWVTEAEAFVSKDADIVATQVMLSSRKALELGAQKIFYTSQDFSHKPGQGQGIKEEPNLPAADPSLDGLDPIGTYQKIFTTL